MTSAADPPVTAPDVIETRVVRWVAPLFAVCSVALVPWVVVLALTLPSHQLSHHYDLAWAGYDIGLAGGLATTAVFALRRSRLLPVAASATGALLVADAWFDVVMSAHGSARLEALVMAAFIELPLAVLCVWLSVHSAELTERRIVLLQRRARRTR